MQRRRVAEGRRGKAKSSPVSISLRFLRTSASKQEAFSKQLLNNGEEKR